MALIGGFLLYFWHAPWLWPLKILVVLFHELGHATAAWLTGGSVVEIGLNPMQGGQTLTRGGLRLLILNAGYLGSLATGVALLWAGRTDTHARWATTVLVAVTATVALAFVRPFFGFGQVFTLLATVGLVGLLRFAPTDILTGFVRFLGVFSVMYAIFDIRDDVFSAPTDAVTDATMLSDLTHLPAVFWGGLWIALGGYTLWRLRSWLV